MSVSTKWEQSFILVPGGDDEEKVSLPIFLHPQALGVLSIFDGTQGIPRSIALMYTFLSSVVESVYAINTTR